MQVIRMLTFNVALNSITPSAQSAGASGDVAQVSFILPDELCSPEYFYHFDYADGNGDFFTSGNIPLSSNSVSLILPSKWTSAGTATIRLVISKFIEGAEVMRYQTMSAKIAFQQKG